jgi:hypothetical protein
VLQTGNNLYGEIGVCVVNGNISFDGRPIGKGNLFVAAEGLQPEIEVGKDSHLLLLGGESFSKTRHIYWNFVSSSMQKIEEAKTRWKEHRFPEVPGDDTYVPLI